MIRVLLTLLLIVLVLLVLLLSFVVLLLVLLLLLLHLIQHAFQVVFRVRIVGVEAQRLLVCFEARLQLLPAVQRVSEVVPRRAHELRVP